MAGYPGGRVFRPFDYGGDPLVCRIDGRPYTLSMLRRRALRLLVQEAYDHRTDTDEKAAPHARR